MSERKHDDDDDDNQAASPHVKRFRKSNWQSSNASSFVAASSAASAGRFHEPLPHHARFNCYGANCDTYYEVMWQTLSAKVPPSREVGLDGKTRANDTNIPPEWRKGIAEIMDTTFVDFFFCDVPKDERNPRVHKCLVERNPIGDMERDQLCGLCPVNGTPVTDGQIKGPLVRGPKDVDVYRDAWNRSYEELRNVSFNSDVSMQRGVENARKHHSSGNLAARREFDDWLQYSFVVFDLVRRKVIEAYNHPTEATRAAKFPNLRAYERCLLDYEFAFSQRNAHAVSTGGSRGKQQTRVGVPQQWCFMHNRPGNLLPSRGITGHDRTCWICPTIALSVAAPQRMGAAIRSAHDIDLAMKGDM